AHIGDVRDALRPLGFDDAKVSILSGRNGQSVNVQEHVVTDPLETVRERLATYGGVSPADVQFNSAQSGSGGSFTFTAARSVEPSKDAINRALAATELRDQTITINGQNVT